MLSKVYTAAISGINAYPVTVETDISHGLPAMYTVGLPICNYTRGQGESALGAHKFGL